jgi:hypothetical protein
MRNAITQYTERKIALINRAQDIAKEEFKKFADAKKLVSRSTYKTEYTGLVNKIIQKLIDCGIVEDSIALGNAFGKRMVHGK